MPTLAAQPILETFLAQGLTLREARARLAAAGSAESGLPLVQADGDVGAPRAPAGRPSIVTACGLAEPDIRAIQRLALTSPRWTDCVSLSQAVRQYAEQLDPAHPFRAWVAARHTKHHLPASLIDALGFPKVPGGGRGGRLVAHDQAPGRERLKYEASAVGCLRRDRTGQLLAVGARESWDDGTQNYIFWHEIDGQVVCGRFQLLVGMDSRSSFIFAFAFVARGTQAYTGNDVVAQAFAPTWASIGKPADIVLERGIWEGHRVTEFLELAGVPVLRSYHPRTKLIEGGFHRLWTLLGDMPGNVGRSRGENELGTALLLKARRGGLDPRKTFLHIEEAARRVRTAIAQLNQIEIQSRVGYGNWVPAVLWEQAAQNRRPLPAGIEWLARSERATVTVRQDGTVRPRLTDAWGIKHEFAFGWADGWKHQGAQVTCYFSGEPARAAAEGCAILAADGKTVLTPKADALAGNAMAAVELRKAAAQSVRAEHRALRANGTLVAWQSEIREQEGTTLRAMNAGATPTDRTAEAAPAPDQRSGLHLPDQSTERTASPARTELSHYRPRLSEADIEAAFADAAMGL